MKKRWCRSRPLLWCLLVFVLALVAGGLLVLTGVIAYAVQKSRLTEKK